MYCRTNIYKDAATLLGSSLRNCKLLGAEGGNVFTHIYVYVYLYVYVCTLSCETSASFVIVWLFKIRRIYFSILILDK